MTDGRKASEKTDRLFRASEILPLNGAERRPVGVFVRDGMVRELVYEERRADTLAASNRVEVVDRRDACLVPGFTDGHIHMKWFGDSLREPDLSDLDRYENAPERVLREAPADADRDTEWIHGRGWSRERVHEDRGPHWRDLEHPQLDDVPVALAARDHHSYWVNRTALRKLGIDEHTASPDGGTIVTDDEGQPTGLLREKAADPLHDELRRDRRNRSTTDLLRDAVDRMFHNGITSVHDIGRIEHLDGYRTLLDRDVPLPRVVFFLLREDFDRFLDRGHNPGVLRAGLTCAGLKLYADGTLSSRTAAMTEPYEDAEEPDRGTMLLEPEEMKQEARRAAAAGGSTAIHAIGDRAVQVSLDVLTDVYGNYRDVTCSPRIEHAQLVRKQDLRRWASADITASLQPCHLLDDRSAARRYWGDRADRAFPIGTLHRSGVSVLFGSDAPIEPPDPLRNLQSAVHRGASGASPWNASEAVSIQEALLLHCVPSAGDVNRLEENGALRPGTAGDLVVLSDNPLEVRPDRLASINVLETYFRGERVYASS